MEKTIKTNVVHVMKEENENKWPFLFAIVWLVMFTAFSRGCDGEPSQFEKWLEAHYEYEVGAGEDVLE